jgi:hypothetical protein
LRVLRIAERMLKGLLLIAVAAAVHCGNHAPAQTKQPAAERSLQPVSAKPKPEPPDRPPTGRPAPSARPQGAECPKAPIEAARTVHYVCDCAPGAEPNCKPGSDDNDGRSPATPFRSYEKARATFESAQAGDMLAFCRGGVIEISGDRRWSAPGCRAARPCVIRDYVAPWKGSRKPELRTSKPGHGIAFEEGGAPAHDEGYVVMGLSLRGAKEGSGVFMYNDVDDVMLCDLDVDGFELGVYVGGANPTEDGRKDARNDRVTLRNSRITNNAHQGWLGGCDGCAVEYNYFENNGFARDVLLHHIYLSGEVKNERVVGNELYRNAHVGGRCSAVALVVHGQVDGLLIENNVIREDVGKANPGCWGIAVDTGYPGKAEGFSNVKIRGNKVFNVGNVGIGLNACRKCVIESNVIVHEQPHGSTLIAVPDRDRDPSEPELFEVTVRNNSLFVGEGTGGTGIRLGREGRGHSATGNKISYRGDGKSLQCFDFDLAETSYVAREPNVCGAGPAYRAP